MSTSIKEACEKLDNLMLHSMELMEKKVQATIEMENQLRDGRIELAKARYIRGKESVGIFQIPQETPISSLFDLETTYDNDRFDTRLEPHFDISLKRKKEIDSETQNPIKWFGVLVPQNLKIAQKKFQECICLAVKIANINAELESTSQEFQDMKKIKNQLKHISEE